MYKTEWRLLYRTVDLDPTFPNNLFLVVWRNRRSSHRSRAEAVKQARRLMNSYPKDQLSLRGIYAIHFWSGK